MTTTISPSISAFMAQPTDDLEEDTDLGPIEAALANGDPLSSIAGSLALIADALSESRAEEDRANENATLVHESRAAYDDLEAKHAELWDLLATVEKIVAKSTSKVSLDVKAAINDWRNPEASEPEPEEPSEAPTPGEHARPEQPAHDAPVEEWRAYCRELRPAEFLPTSLDTMNRSQIRTFLGVEQLA